MSAAGVWCTNKRVDKQSSLLLLRNTDKQASEQTNKRTNERTSQRPRRKLLTTQLEKLTWTRLTVAVVVAVVAAAAVVVVVMTASRDVAEIVAAVVT